MNDDFHEASFEVYYVSVSQKLVILEFSPQFFFILTSVTSNTSWGQSMSLSNLYEVSILAEDVSFHMKHCLFDQYQIWIVQRQLSAKGTDQKARIV